MKVKDITSIMVPWQSLRIMKKNSTQLDEPLFDNILTSIFQWKTIPSIKWKLLTLMQAGTPSSCM